MPKSKVRKKGRLHASGTEGDEEDRGAGLGGADHRRTAGVFGLVWIVVYYASNNGVPGMSTSRVRQLWSSASCSSSASVSLLDQVALTRNALSTG